MAALCVGAVHAPVRCEAVAAMRDSAEIAVCEMLEPCGDFPSKLEWLAYWLDCVDAVLEIAGEPQGRDVQRDLRRWAGMLRGA